MLKKLLKYDLKWLYKVLVLFYGLTIGSAMLSRILSAIGTNSTIFSILGSFTNGLTVGLMIAILFNSTIRILTRFVKNIYKDESYLTHTLPVTKKDLYLSKFISAMIVLFTSIIVILISLFILFYSKENMLFLKQSLETMAILYDSSVVAIILMTTAVLFLELAVIILVAYVGIIIGFRSDNKRVLKSFFWGVGLFLLTQVITLFFIFLVGVFNPNIMDLFTTNNSAISFAVFKGIMLLGAIIYLIHLIAYYLIGLKSFEKGVNVD